MKNKVFPQKIALGSSFCNRVRERQLLLELLSEVRPTLITSPRRYGKTSLGIFVLEQQAWPYAHIDFFPAVSHEDVTNLILGAIGEIVAKLESTQQKALKLVSTFFSDLNVSFRFINTHVDIDFNRDNSANSKTLSNALVKLDLMLTKKKKQAVIFLDEFQRLSQIKGSEVIEGAIRFVAQKSKALGFLFSGSNRHMLSKMFDDSARPLYKLCDRIVLDRISADDYRRFINTQAKKLWNSALDDETIDLLLELTECHAYYVNVLCSRLWRQENIIVNNDVLAAWKDYAIEEKSAVSKELDGLSQNQFKYLVALARAGGTETPLAESFLLEAILPLSSSRQALNVLTEKDYVMHKEKIGRASCRERV